MSEPTIRFVEGMLACDDPRSDRCNDTVVELIILTETEPRFVWQVIREVIALNPPDRVLGALGAGPLEGLMWRHGRELIGEVEAEAQRTPVLRELLGGIYRGDEIDDETWARIVKISGRPREFRNPR